MEIGHDLHLLEEADFTALREGLADRQPEYREPSKEE